LVTPKKLSSGLIEKDTTVSQITKRSNKWISDNTVNRRTIANLLEPQREPNVAHRRTEQIYILSVTVTKQKAQASK